MTKQALKPGELPATGYVRQSQLIPHIIPVSPAHFWRMVKAGEFVRPVKLSARICVGDVAKVRAWLESKANA